MENTLLRAITTTDTHLRHFSIEAWTAFAVGIIFTSLRTFARVRQVGPREFQADDYLIWVAMLFYAAEASLAHFGVTAGGLANNGLTAMQRQNLDPNGQEYALRIIGSKIQLAGWLTSLSLLWSLKACWLFLYVRLTVGLRRTYLRRIYFGFALLITTYLTVVLTVLLGCRPFAKNWQINPSPGNACQPAISAKIVWVYTSLDLFTDLYLLSIPIPMLWNTTLKPLKKIGLTALFSGGIVVMIFAILRATLTVSDPINGAQTSGFWAIRESFVSVITTNLPMVFPLLRKSRSPKLGFLNRIFHRSSGKKPVAKETRGDGYWSGREDRCWRDGHTPDAYLAAELGHSESEDRILGLEPITVPDIASSHDEPEPQNNDTGRTGHIRVLTTISIVSSPQRSKQRLADPFLYELA
ncbi:hypothetical protein F5Y18DRAFT_425681 [Xylariaceae sp. FL1019]|nr:hypothetical protein F5Y18DRAFT_425681 [Xylariaceae sp. FL1019]